MANEQALAGIQHRLVSSEAIQRVVGTDGATLAVNGPGQAITLAAFQEISDAPVIVITPTMRDAEALAHDLACFFPQADHAAQPGASLDDVVLFPSWDTLPLERVSPDVATMGQRLAVRWRLASPTPPAIVVAPVRALLQRLPQETLTPLVVSKGDELASSALIDELVTRGYRREHQVEHRGEFSVRGGILDVFGSTALSPVRLDLFGDEVDRLTTFDVGDQRSRHDIEQAWLFGCREFIVTDEVKERARQQAVRLPWASSMLQRLADGNSFDGMEGWFGFVTDGHQLLVDQLSAPLSVVLVEPGRVRDRAVELLEEEEALVSSLLSTWASGDPGIDPSVIGLHVPFDRLLSETTLPVISLPTSAASEADPQIATSSLLPVAGDAGRLAEHINALVARGFRVLGLGAHESSTRRLQEVLAGEGLSADIVATLGTKAGIGTATSPLARGCILPEFKIAILAEPDITGRRVPHRPARTQQHITDGFFDDLEIGSYVVHRVHGVARFRGVTTRTIGGTTRDYMVLEFRGDDRIYLPVDQVDSLTPYSGGESPSLSKMGGSDWQRTQSKARAAASEIAEELVALYQQRSVVTGFAFSPDTPWQEEMEAAFPYELTPDQARAVREIKADMERERPMDRLVVADVGFGKTEIAVRAAFKAVQDGKQVAVLCPTTLLASQHFATFQERYGGYPINVAMLSRFLTDKEATDVKHALSEGAIDVVIGTHRLLSEDIVIKDLGLLVVDEEQRFGVSHKEVIKRMSTTVDVVTLSANPIPRTLEMALTGIRDLSMVTTPPTDRRPILTYVGEFDERAATEAIRRELLREGQVFYVHNRVSDIEDVARSVRRLVPEARVAVAHGQMDEGTLEQIVMEFADRNYDVLVCTTIVESGIDMPSVNTMVVDRADRLGLGQLHQLRGRVGRGGARAYAYLFHPRDQVLSETAYERLRTIGEHTDLGSGFKIAMRDLEIRGAGNLLGRDQSGHVAAVGYDLYVQLVAEAVAEAKGIVPAEKVSVSLDVPGDAHLPVTYVGQDDLRLEAYRRLATTSTANEVLDVATEWKDRFGPLPAPAQGLIEVALLRAACLARGVKELTVLPARTGGRSVPMAKLKPLPLLASAQVRVQRILGERAYDATSATLRVELATSVDAAKHLRLLLEEIVPLDQDQPAE